MTEERESRSFISDRREQVKALPRPEKLSNLDIAASVQGARDEEDLMKVYVDEWVIRYTSTLPGQLGLQQAHEFFNDKQKGFVGRVYDDDVRYEPTSTTMPEKFPYRLLLRMPNVRGEFKTRELAQAYADSIGEEAIVVPRNSRQDYKLRAYGKNKISS